MKLRDYGKLPYSSLRLYVSDAEIAVGRKGSLWIGSTQATLLTMLRLDLRQSLVWTTILGHHSALGLHLADKMDLYLQGSLFTIARGLFSQGCSTVCVFFMLTGHYIGLTV